MAEVIWKPIRDYAGLYEVSNDGRVRRIAHRVKIGNTNPFLPTKEKKLSINNKGYAVVVLYKGNTQKHAQVHRLVATAFIDNPNNYPQVNHKDENKLNNSVENLEWCTNKYNSNYGTRGDRISKANTNGKQSKSIIGKNNTEILCFPSINEASRMLGIQRSNIIAALKGRRKNAGGYIWEYQF